MRRTEIIVFVSAVVISLLIGLSSLLPAEIYSSAIWHILWIAIAVALIFGIIMGRLWRNGPAFIMHIAFLFMIVGGFCTSLSSRRGTLHLFPSQTADCFISANGKMEKLPSAVTLLSFAPEYYPGMNFPKDFKSELKVASGDTMR
ncbi:MAG: cytochrome c biogenesis protein ResB, partial [Muribaculaceae bacterium]|nr:cytochrome c biogenesis protein ResB [Muribaculaceae bacterium]